MRCINPYKSLEIIHNPKMYLVEGFVPKYDEVVYDVGSQFGDWAVLWAKKYGARVYAFEPLKFNVEVIKDNIALNAVENRVHVLNTAVGDGSEVSYCVDGDMMRYTSSNPVTSHSLALDDLIRGKDGDVNSVPLPSILKIDVEGFEMQVLQGARNIIKSCQPRIIIEVHSFHLKQHCGKFLQEAGYVLTYSDGGHPRKGWMDHVENEFWLPEEGVNAKE